MRRNMILSKFFLKNNLGQFPLQYLTYFFYLSIILVKNDFNKLVKYTLLNLK